MADVPSRIDLRSPAAAATWAANATEERPWRTEFFDGFVSVIASSSPESARVLELGSGPGFLAHRLLVAFPTISYVALDFSEPMHALARTRLGDLASRVTFVLRSFRERGWTDELGAFDWVVTHQAVHELRHERRARSLHAQVLGLLSPTGGYLVSDHHAGDGGMSDDRLYMTVDEQLASLRAAGFANVHQILLKGGMVLHHAAGHFRR